MDSIVVVKQMAIIFILILVGVLMHHRGRLGKETVGNVSWLVINICNPMTLIYSALSSKTRLSVSELAAAVACFAVMYALLFAMAYVLPVLLRTDKADRYPYVMLTLYTNVGFIGIPFVAAVLGNDALVYVSICCLVFNILIYTHGIHVMKKAGNAGGKEHSLLNIINAGTVSSLITIVIFATGIRVPTLVSDTVNYMGKCTTMLSMLVLGAAVANMNVRSVFGSLRLYIFTAVRGILLPVIITYIMIHFTENDMLSKVIMVMAALPCANMPLMLAKEYEADESVISAGIILTTLMSVVTLPIVVTICL